LTVVDLPRLSVTVVDRPRKARDDGRSATTSPACRRIDHPLWAGVDGGRCERSATTVSGPDCDELPIRRLPRRPFAATLNSEV